MQVLVDIPDEMARLLDETGSRADLGLLLEVAGSMVSRGLLSSGRAARLLGMERLDFIEQMSRRKISILGNDHWGQEGI